MGLSTDALVGLLPGASEEPFGRSSAARKHLSSPGEQPVDNSSHLALPIRAFLGYKGHRFRGEDSSATMGLRKRGKAAAVVFQVFDEQQVKQAAGGVLGLIAAADILLPKTGFDAKSRAGLGRVLSVQIGQVNKNCEKPAGKAGGLGSMEAAAQIWSAAQKHLQTLLAPDIYSLWFEPIRASHLENDAITLEVADEFREVWLKENYQSVLEDALAVASGRRIKVCFRVAAEPAAAPPARLVPSGRPVEVRSQSARAAEVREVQFNPKNTFETFVVGSNNNFAYAAALAVAQSPGKAYNPLFLYGGVGLGKTHLLHAIGQHVLSQKAQARVAYVSCEKFTNEFIDALQNNSLMQFRRKYRSTDVLLIDDVHFLSGKERIQEEFFHTFNALHESRKQIVLTCDRPASEIQGLEQRLVSRFEWGLVADLQPPDVEMRLAILRKKAALMGAQVSEEILNFLANHIRSNIRRLEGALIRVVSFASLTGKPVTVANVEMLLREILHEEGRSAVTIDRIMKIVADRFDIRVSDMTSRRRPENIAFPRQVAMYLARRLTGMSYSAIGEAFGGRDHGTVLHACRLVKDRMDVDSTVRQQVYQLERELLK